MVSNNLDKRVLGLSTV